MIELCRQETHIARKVHKCSLCNGDILPKTKYYEIIAKCDGRFCDDKYHILCNDLINDFCKDNETNEFYTYDVEDYYKDKYCYNCINEKTCTMSTKQRKGMRKMRWFKGNSRIKKKFAILPIRINSEVRWLEIVYIYQKKERVYGYDFWCDIEFSTKQKYLKRKAEEKEYLEK